MIGAGVFTTSGLLLNDIPSPTGILWCWVVGGVAALFGALAFAELGVAMAENGGEYRFLSSLFHPSIGFLSAWSSLIVGFAAPLAAIALAFGHYLQVFLPGVSPRLVGAVLIVLLSTLNLWRIGATAGFQNAFTVGKVALLLVFIVIGWLRADPSLLTPASAPPLGATILSPGFAVGLLWVSFAYTGWNAAAYVAGEVRDPARVLPRALVMGTLLVTLLYVAANAVFLAAAPMAALKGKVEVGHVAAEHLLGSEGGRVLTAIILLGFVSTIGALVVTGPRIYEAVGRDFTKLWWLGYRREGGGPVAATVLQSSLALVMLLAANVDTLMSYIGFTLSIFSALTVSGVFKLRMTKVKSGFRMPGYPVTPLLFVALMVWMVVWGILATPRAALAGLATIVVGLLLYALSNDRSPRVRPPKA